MHGLRRQAGIPELQAGGSSRGLRPSGRLPGPGARVSAPAKISPGAMASHWRLSSAPDN